MCVHYLRIGLFVMISQLCALQLNRINTNIYTEDELTLFCINVYRLNA